MINACDFLYPIFFVKKRKFINKKSNITLELDSYDPEVISRHKNKPIHLPADAAEITWTNGVSRLGLGNREFTACLVVE